MDSTLHDYKGWMLSIGITLTVMGTTTLLTPLMLGVEKVLDEHGVALTLCAGGILFGTGLVVAGRSASGPLPKGVIFFGTLIASTSTIMLLLTLFGILP